MYVPDTLSSSQEKSFGSIKSSQDVSLDNNLDGKILNVKRATVSWENSLEDVVENEDLVEDLEKTEETQNMETELTEEDIDKTLEECRVFSSHKNKVCLKNSAWLSPLKLGFVPLLFVCVCDHVSVCMQGSEINIRCGVGVVREQRCGLDSLLPGISWLLIWVPGSFNSK